jgi:hypothetical protein
MLFVVWQDISVIAFRSLPAIPILVGGALVISGGPIISLWNPSSEIRAIYLRLWIDSTDRIGWA